MKKILCLLFILTIAFSLVACKKNKGSKSTINGVSLDSYSIVYSDEDYDYSKRAAEYIKSTILTRTNIDLALVEDSSAAVTEYEIVVGNTDRDISKNLDADTEGLEFAIYSEGKQIALEGDYFIIAAAAYFFVETYVPMVNYAATVPNGLSIHTPIVKEAKNYIMLIGDGMGVNQTKMPEYFENDLEYGDGESIFYGYYLPYHGYSRTNSLSGVTDSAAGGTALSCGIKTNNGYIGRDKDLNDVQSLTELADEYGMSAGVMSTETKNGATPAAFSAHADSRNSTAEIIMKQAEARELYGTVIDCGYSYYSQRYVGVIEDKVVTMLDTLDDDEDGFFLMYEEAHIDKYCHLNDMDKVYQSVIRFNQIIAIIMEYAFYNPETFVLITADHETGDLFANDKSELAFHSTEHTGKNVPIFAYGDGAELFDGVTVENIQIAHTIAHFMGDENFGDQSKYKSLAK